MIDPVEFGKAMGSLIREATTPLLKRIEELEARQLERGEKGDPGKDAEPVAVADVAKELAPSVAESLAELVAKYFADNPVQHGKDGKDAEPVMVSDVVKELVDCPDLTPVLDLLTTEAVSKYMDENPVPAGKDGRDGVDGKDGQEGPRGLQGEKGMDGIGLAGAVIDRDGELTITKTNGEPIKLGPVVGKDGEKGQDGKDGLGFDDFSADYDGERTVTLKWIRGEQVKKYTWSLPVVIHKGFWREGMSAVKGDSITHAGSLWIALRDTKAAPGYDAKDDWILAARKGRDGDKGDPGTPIPRETVKLHD